MNILVTGGAGFIGSHTVDALLENAHNVVVVDNLWEAGGGTMENFNNGATMYMLDVRSTDDVRAVFCKHMPDIVYHFAAQHSVTLSAADPEHDIDVNLRGLLNILRLCVEYDVKKIIFSSSLETHGIVDDLPITEGTPQHPTSPYGITKTAAEYYIKYYYETYGLEYNILRYGNVYGPRQDARGEAGVISIFAKNMLNKKPIRIDWDGMQKKDFVYIDDVVSANISMLDVAENETFCIASRFPVSINTLHDLLIDIIGYDVDVIYGEKRPGDMPIRYASYAKAASAFGWTPSVALRDGIVKTVEWLKARI